MLRIKYELDKAHLKQIDLARRTGLMPQAVSRIVRGTEPPYPKRGQRIADALDWNRPWQELFEEIEVD